MMPISKGMYSCGVFGPQSFYFIFLIGNASLGAVFLISGVKLPDGVIVLLYHQSDAHLPVDACLLTLSMPLAEHIVAWEKS